jgi:hypothetical protein
VPIFDIFSGSSLIDWAIAGREVDNNPALSRDAAPMPRTNGNSRIIDIPGKEVSPRYTKQGKEGCSTTCQL